MATADLDPSGPWLTVRCDRSEYHLAQAIPGCNFRRDQDLWRAPASWAAWVSLRTAWAGQPIQVTPALDAAVAWWYGMVQARMAARLRLDAEGRAAELLDKIEAADGPGHKLDLTHRGGAAWLWQWGRKIPGLSGAALFDDAGVGKTGQVIRALQMLAEDGENPYPALWACRGSAIWALRDKIAGWAPELTVEVCAGTAGQRKKAIEATAGDGTARGADILLIGWPNIRFHTRLARYPAQEFTCCARHGGSNPKITAAGCEVHEKELNEVRWGTVIADEAHAMQDPKSKQTRAMWHLAHHAARFWPVTGTPGEIIPVWSIQHALDPSAFPARSRFQDLWAQQEYNWFGGSEILGLRPEHEAGYHAITDPLFRRIPTAVARPYQPEDLEPEFYWLDLPHKAAQAYAGLRREVLAELDETDLAVPNTAVKFTRMRQLCDGWLERSDGEDKDGFTKDVWQLCLPSHKADWLAEFAGDNPEPLVVSAWSPMLAVLCERKLKAAEISSVMITGGMTAQAQYEAQQRFQDGTARVCLITDAGGESIDLQASRVIVYLDPEPSQRKRVQKKGRIGRRGQDRAIRTVHVLTRGTLEQRLFELGEEKAERAAQITQDAALMRWLLDGGDPG